MVAYIPIGIEAHDCSVMPVILRRVTWGRSDWRGIEVSFQENENPFFCRKNDDAFR